MTERTVAVVTGGARGIGRAIAEELLRRGHAVVLTDVNGELAAQTAGEIGATAGLHQDIRDAASHHAVAAAAGEHGRVAAWFNNAGVGDDGRLTENSEEQVRRLVEVNVLGTMWGIRAALAAFGDRGGDVVNTASLAGLGPVPGYSAYAATKAAVVSISMSVDAETPRNVRVHAVCPDVVQTAMLTEGHTAGSLGTRLAHSGGTILEPADVARQAVDLIGRRRVVLSVPRSRGLLVRATAVAPSVSQKGMPLFEALGKRALAKHGRS